jgi:spore coat protein CotH
MTLQHARSGTILLAVWLAAALTGPVLAAAPPARSVVSTRGRPAEVFGLMKVWSMHLTISPGDWAKMAPTRDGFARGRPAPVKEGRKPRRGFGYDFEYVKADLEIDGARLKDVGVRFKGNSTYALSSRVLKRPFKIDLDRFVEGQTFKGVKKFVLNNNVVDRPATREALAYALYREAGVQAPRTAYVQLRLTIPGKYKNEVVGLYTLIEAVDRSFLKDRFGSARGLLLKPERVGPLDYLGEKWPEYEKRYRPKRKSDPKARQRLIDLTRLVQQADDARLRKEIGGLLDVDRFLRYLAATVLMSSLDNFIGFAHNYYLYLDPKTNRFVILPWDLDHSFGALVLLGSANDLMNLSIRKPYLGRNRLVEALLADEKTFAVYKGHLERLLKTSFTVGRIKTDLEAIRATLKPFQEQEARAVGKRGENFSWSLLAWLVVLGRPPEVAAFTTKRIASVREQLEGRSSGAILRPRFTLPGLVPPAQPVRPILAAADLDKDQKLSRDEVITGAQALFKACDRGATGSLDQRALEMGLARLLPRRLAGGGTPRALARGIFDRAGQEGKLTEKALVAAAEKLFAQVDKDKRGKLDEKQLTEAIRLVLPPAFGLPEVPRGPADKTRGSKEVRK